MNDHPHSHDEPKPQQPAPPETPVDPGSQALAEALRSSFAVVKVVMVALVIVFFGSGFFQVGPQERAILLRFGKPVGEREQALLGPGLHWSLPYPIDEYVKVSISGIKTVKSTVGWFAVTPEQEAAGTIPAGMPTLNPAIDGYVVTADGNIIHCRAWLDYRVEDPVEYVFGFVNASNAVQNALNNALVYAAAQYNVDDILTRDLTGFRATVRRRVTQLLDERKLGVVVEDCRVDRRPPRQLADAFDAVGRAEITRSKVLNDAYSYTNEVLNRAIAESGSLVNAAQAERVRVVSEVRSDAERFTSLLPQYRENPHLFVQKDLIETIGRVFTNAHYKLYVPERTDELRLLLNRELPKAPRTNNF